jgi:hypothetical protein
MQRFSIGTQSQEDGPVARQIVCGGQLPPHSPAESGALHGWSVVVYRSGLAGRNVSPIR